MPLHPLWLLVAFPVAFSIVLFVAAVLAARHRDRELEQRAARYSARFRDDEMTADDLRYFVGSDYGERLR